MEEVSLTAKESRFFSDLFLCCDVEQTGKITMLKAIELFQLANLTNDTIREITSLAGIPQTALHISRTQFYSCLKLIAAHQASMTLRTELIASSVNLPLPRFCWKESPQTIIPATDASSSNNSLTSSAVSIDRQVFVSNVLSATLNSALLTRREPTSKQEWDGNTCPDVFELGRTQPLQVDNINSDVLSTDSEVENNESSGGRPARRRRGEGGSPEAYSTNSDSPTPTNSVAERPWAKETLWQGLLGDEHRQLLGTEEESSDRHSSDEDNEVDLESVYQITAEQRDYYHKQFKAVQPDPNGFLSGHIARVFFEKSRIHVDELRHIWKLCDVTRDGALSLAEFTAAMHLVVLRRNNIPLPQVLPASLHPSVLSQTASKHVPHEPPEADLLHLNDDNEKVDTTAIVAPNSLEKDTKLIDLNPIGKNSQPGVTSNPITNSSLSPPPIKPRSMSNSPSADATTPPLMKLAKGKELVKDWTNQSREWTKFTESPTSNVSSPGPKPANFDMQRTAQAVVSDPQILHPVPLRVTPVGAELANDDDNNRILRKSENLVYDASVGVLRENDSSSPKPQSQNSQANSQNHRDSLQNNDLRAIQRPQPKKLPAKNIGAIPPPPQREPSVGGTSIDSGDNIVTTNGSNLPIKKDAPPIPPPRPHRHGRSSSLDLNKFKMGSTSIQPEITAQASFDIQTINDNIDNGNSEFADFAHFPEENKSLRAEHLPTTHIGNDTYAIQGANIPPPPRPTITSIQSNQRVSAFEVYRKPSTPRNSQSPDSLQHINQQHLQLPPAGQAASTSSLGHSNNTSSSAVSISSGTEYDKRVTAISETFRHVSFKKEPAPAKYTHDVLRQLREQNVVLLRLCNDLSEELLLVQQKKVAVRNKLESANSACLSSVASGGSGVVSANVTGGSGSSGVHSNV